MATIYVYDNNSNRIERFERGLDEPMPYNTGNTLSVREFRARSCSSILWTDRRTMDAWNTFRRMYGKPIPIGYVFRRPWEGGHGKQSQHYAGVAFDVGQALSLAERNNLRQAAINSGVWSYVEPAYLTPTWVHFDKRQEPPACSAGYPMLRQESRGNYVFILQDLLNALGYGTGGLDGVFGNNTRNAVQRYQRENGLTADGVVGCSSWQSITNRGVGIGQTNTVIGKCQ